MIEDEVRGKINRSGFNKLLAFLNKKAKLIKTYKRLSLDLSPGFIPEKRTWGKGSKFDLRIKKSGKDEKISLKVGEFHLQKREEIEVDLKSGDFINAAKMLETIGFNTGMIYFWESWEYEYGGCETKVSKYTDDYFTWEIESKNQQSDPNLLARELGLHPYTKEQYRESIDWEKKNIHQIYSDDVINDLLNQFNEVD